MQSFSRIPSDRLNRVPVPEMKIHSRLTDQFCLPSSDQKLLFVPNMCRLLALTVKSCDQTGGWAESLQAKRKSTKCFISMPDRIAF